MFLGDKTMRLQINGQQGKCKILWVFTERISISSFWFSTEKFDISINYSQTIHKMVWNWFIFYSQKSISSYQKSIIPLFSTETECYNTDISNVAGNCFWCRIENLEFQKRIVRRLFGGIAMKNMKQLLVNAMEEYGNILILSDRFWSKHNRPQAGVK